MNRNSITRKDAYKNRDSNKGSASNKNEIN